MGMPLERKAPDRPATERTTKDLLELVHKLRWAEAERLLKSLRHAETPAQDKVVATPSETD
jgi:hypothetical protein